MRWGAKRRPEGVQDFDRAIWWRYAWYPRWDNINEEWVWLEWVAIGYYWSPTRKAWTNHGYQMFYSRPVIFDCREQEPRGKSYSMTVKG